MKNSAINIRPLGRAELERATEFVAERLSPDRRSYPVIDDITGARNELEKRIEKDTVLGAFCGERMTGIVAGFGDGAQYFQTTMIYADDSKSADALIDGIVKQNNDAQILAGIDGRNIGIGRALSKRGFAIVERDIDARLDTEKLVPSPCENVIRLGDEHKKAWLEFHRKYFDDIYWNAERMDASFKEWDIYAVLDGGRVSDGAFVKAFGNGSAEIFGLVAERSSVTCALLTAVARDLRTRKHVKNIIYFIDETSTNDVAAAIKTGFDCNGKYVCYELKNRA